MRNATAISKREGLSTARVSQIRSMLKLAPEVLADARDENGVGPIPSETALRKLVKVRPRFEQVKRYRELVVREAEQERQRPGRGASRVRRRGFQHLFAQARDYQDRLDRREVASLSELARQEGMTSGRVAQLLNLLHLAPQIRKVVDVSADEVPAGITEKMLRKVARQQDHDEQCWTFRRLLSSALGKRDPLALARSDPPDHLPAHREPLGAGAPAH